MPLCYLFETFGKDEAGAATHARFTNGGGYAHPTAPGFYEPRIASDGDDAGGLTVERAVFQRGEFGAGDVSLGAVRAADPTGGLDHFLRLGMGHPATLRLGDDAQPFSAFETVLTARCRSVTASAAALSFQWEGRLAELDQPACPATFAGTNTGLSVNDLEGTPDDLKGRRKPWAMGRVRDLTPMPLNYNLRVFGWNWHADGTRAATNTVHAVKFAASPWTFDADYPTASALLASTPVNGHYTTCRAESLILMGGSAPLNGAITVDVSIEPTGSARQAGNLWRAVLRRAGVAAGDIDADALAALNAAAPFAAGYYAQDDDYRRVADALAASVAACYVPDRLGVYRIRQMSAPAGLPVAEFTRLQLGTGQGPSTGDLLDLAPQLGGDAWTPVREARVRWGRNWTPLAPQAIASGVTPEQRAAATTEWRTTDPAASPATAAKYGNAVAREWETCLDAEADAEAIRDVLLALFAEQRREYRASVTYGPGSAAALDLGAVVRLTHPKYGLDAGVLARVHALRLRDSTRRADLTLWL